MPSLKIMNPSLDDEGFAIQNYGIFELGISNLINLAIMRRMGIHEIYTADMGFRNTGIKVFYELAEASDSEALLIA